MVYVREAKETDNIALLKMEAKCPMGTKFIINRDSSPDFFDRTKPYKDSKLFVAEKNNRIAGAAGAVIRDTKIAGTKVRGCYEYGFLVDPDYRRNGIASKIHDQIEEYAITRNADLLTLDVLEDNIPAMKLFEKKGFIQFKNLYNYPYRTTMEYQINYPNVIRCATSEDLDKITDLLNYTYKGFDHYKEYSSSELSSYIERIPYFSLQDISIYESENEIKACIGYWNNWKVYRWKIIRLSEQMISEAKKTGTNLFSPGDVFKGVKLVFLGYRDSDAVVDLLKYNINRAKRESIFGVGMMVDTDCHLNEVLRQVPHNPLITIHCYAKAVNDSIPKLGSNLYYFDQIDT